MGKYRKGSRITCMEELVKQDVVFFREKVLHRAFFSRGRFATRSSRLSVELCSGRKKLMMAATTEKKFWGYGGRP